MNLTLVLIIVINMENVIKVNVSATTDTAVNLALILPVLKTAPVKAIVLMGNVNAIKDIVEEDAINSR